MGVVPIFAYRMRTSKNSQLPDIRVELNEYDPAILCTVRRQSGGGSQSGAKPEYAMNIIVFAMNTCTIGNTHLSKVMRSIMNNTTLRLLIPVLISKCPHGNH